MRSTSTTPAVWGATSARIALLAAALVGLLAAPLPDPTEAGASPRASSGAKLTKQLKKLKRRIGALEGRPIPIIPTSLPPSGPAGGALAGSYPNPTLNISGGPCANGQALTDVSSLAGLTCGPGVFADGPGNLAAGLTSFPTLAGGFANSAYGQNALVSLTTGSTNSAFGGGALGTADTGARNSAFGNNALTNVDGDSNTAVGDSALGPLTSGDHNTAIGTDAGEGLASGDNNIYVAGTPAPSGATESNTTRIGVPSQTRAFIAGIRGVTTGLNDAIPVLIDSAGQLGTVSSSRRYKQDIRAMGRASDPIMQLRPVTFRYRSDPSGLRYGLIAEQVAKAMPTLAVSGNDGRPETVKYQDLPVLLLNEVQRQRRQLRRQQAQIVRLMHLVRGR